MAEPIAPACPYCGAMTSLTDGKEIYPHRGDLHTLPFYICRPCDAYVGCHKGTIDPMGSPADSATRTARHAAHKAFDPLWRSGSMTRRKAYSWLQKQLKLEPDRCHIALFDVRTCQRLIDVCNRRYMRELNG